MSLRLDCAHMKNLGRWVVGRVLGKRHFCLKRCYLTATLSFFKKKGHFFQSKDTSVFKRTLLLVFFTKKKVYNAVKKNAAVPPKDTLFLKGHFCPYFSSQVEIKNMNIESEAFVCRNRYDHHIEQYLVGVINHLYEAFTTLLLN